MEKDSLLLGRIKEIHKYKLIISLPHNKNGVCLINGISETYNSLVKELVDDDSIPSDVVDLEKMFKKGQFVQVKARKAISNSKLDVTLVPSEINRNVNMKRLKPEMKLQVAIKSREDKGYILELGIGGLNGFLPFEQCSNAAYEIGQLVNVYTILNDKTNGKKQSRVMNFTTKCNKSKSFLSSVVECDFDSILPGMLIGSQLKLQADGSLEGKFHGFTVKVGSDHHKSGESSQKEQIVCVIGSDYSLKYLDCSLLPHLQSPFNGADDLLSIQIGHSEKNCIIEKNQKSSLVVSIPNMKQATGLVTKTHIEPELRQIEQGKAIVARFLDYNLLDNVVLLTTLKKLMSQSYFSVHQAKLGETIKGSIMKFTKSGYSVQISSQLIGLIPIPHLSDKPIHNANSIYKTGEIVQCRVFHIDLAENKLLLTVKKSLMTSNLPIISGFHDFKTGMTLNAFVAKIIDHGLVVVLFNNIKGWVPIARIPNSKQKSLKVSYYVGQPVEVKVVRWASDTKRVELSLKCNVEVDEDNNDEDDFRLVNNISVGDIHEAVVSNVRTSGLNVRLQPMNLSAFLPFAHLSDSRSHRNLLQAYYTMHESDGIKMSVVVISVNDNKIMVSKKNSLIRASQDERILKNSDNVEVGSQWIGWVNKKESYGLFVELPCGVHGLVRNKDISDTKAMKVQATDLFEIGDTVEVKVLELDPKRSNTCLFSLTMSSTYRAKDHMKTGALDFLKNHLEERKFLKSTIINNRVSNIEIGDLVNVEITKQCGWGYAVKVIFDDTDDIVSGIVMNKHLPDKVVSEGSKCRALVIDIDLSQLAVEVCMTGSVINAVANKKNHCTRIDINQNIPSDVLAFNHDFVVAMLKGHANGNIVYIPTKRFWNDMAKEFSWVVNQRNPTIVKSVLPNERFIGSLAINEAIESNDEAATFKNPVNNLFKNLSKKAKIEDGEEYNAYFHSITKNKIFFFITKKQKGFCNLLEYSSSLEELQNLIFNAPEKFSLLDKKAKVISSHKKCNGLTICHFLPKSTIEVNDVICGTILSCYKPNNFRVKLPFDVMGYLDLTKQKHTSFTPRVGNTVQCKVLNVSPKEHRKTCFLSLVGHERLETPDFKNNEEIEKSQNDDVEAMDVEEELENEIEEVNYEPEQEKQNIEVVEEEEKVAGEDEDKERSEETQEDKEESDERKELDELPSIVIKRKSDGKKNNLTSIYKRAHQSDDDDEEEQEDDEAVLVSSDEPPTKQAKIVKVSNVEREIIIRQAEKRREIGENIKNPQNESEFELLVFNYPNDSNSWIRFTKFFLESEKNVDKARVILERAMRVLQVRDSENRFRIMKEYIDLEISQLVVTKETASYDNQIKMFGKILERGLTQKAKLFYIYVCEKLTQNKLFELAEEVAKRFIKEFHYDPMSWFQLFLIRFVQKKYTVIKETLTNAERALKPADFRDMTIRVAQTEIEMGNCDRGVQSLVSIVQKRPKDKSLKKRITTIFEKNNLSEHVAKLDSEPMN